MLMAENAPLWFLLPVIVWGSTEFVWDSSIVVCDSSVVANDSSVVVCDLSATRLRSSVTCL